MLIFFFFLKSWKSLFFSRKKKFPKHVQNSLKTPKTESSWVWLHIFFLFHLAKCSRKKVSSILILGGLDQNGPKKSLDFDKKISFLPFLGVIFWVRGFIFLMFSEVYSILGDKQRSKLKKWVCWSFLLLLYPRWKWWSEWNFDEINVPSSFWDYLWIVP